MYPGLSVTVTRTTAGAGVLTHPHIDPRLPGPSSGWPGGRPSSARLRGAVSYSVLHAQPGLGSDSDLKMLHWNRGGAGATTL